MEDEREKKLREESERAYQRWLRGSGKAEEQKAPKPDKKRSGMKPRAALKYLALCAVFFAAAFGLGWVFSLLSRLPGLGTIPDWVLPLASALLAWGIAVAAGQRLTTTKRSLIVASACLAAFMVISTLPSQPSVNLPPPSPVPEGYVEFYYQASFTFLGGATDTISNVELWLPWPYIDTKETRPLAKPVGLDRWLRIENGHFGAVTEPLIYDYMASVLKPKEREITIFENNGAQLNYAIDIENGIWTTDRIIDYTEIENSKIIYEGQQDMLQTISAYFERAQDKTMAVFQKITVKIPLMLTNDTVTVKYQFFVPKENASKVRVDDWIESYIIWIGKGTYQLKKTYENAPAIYVEYVGSPIQCEFTVSLWKSTDGNSFSEVATYQKRMEVISPCLKVLS